MTPSELEKARLVVRRRALANFLLALLEVARRSGNRFAVEPGGADGVVLHYRDVRTLVRMPNGFDVAVRDFTVFVALPPLWPFEREDEPVPLVLVPDDHAHPNGDGRLFCLDCRGVTPERLATLVYDQLRLKARRLDDAVSATAADYVRTQLGDEPTDPRPLVSSPLPAAAEPTMAAGTSEAEDGVIEVRAGILGVAIPAINGPVVIRFGHPMGDPVDAARAAYLRAVASTIRCGEPRWLGGPALSIDGYPDRTILCAEVRELARTLDALGEPTVASSYLEVTAASAS